MQPDVQSNASATLGLAEFVTLMALLTSLIALSIDGILPAMDALSAELHAESAQHVQLSVSLFFVGMAFGQLFFGPFADAKGRMAAIFLGLFIFVIGSLVCMYAKDMNTFLLGRIIQAFGVSGPRVGSLAAIRDIYSGNAMAKVMSFIMMVFILVPMLAPMIGQVILDWYSWRSIFVFFILVGLVAGAWFYTRQPETLPEKRRKPFDLAELKVSLRFIFTHRQVMNYTIATGFIFGCFLAYISASQTIFVGYYGEQNNFPYIFASLALSIGLASFFNGRIVMRLGMHRLVNYALKGAIGFACVLLAVLYYYQGLPPLALTLFILFIGFFFVGILFGNTNAMAMEHLGHIAGLGAAIVGSLSSAISVPVAVFIDSFLDGDLYPIGIGFLVFFALAKLNMKFASMKNQQA